MNALLGRLQEALERERGFVADAGHELRTPLAILRTELELAGRPSRTRQDLVEAVTRAGEETDRLIRLAEDLLLLARADNHQPFLRPAPVSLPDLLDAAARVASPRAADRNVAITVRAREALWLQADPDRLRQAVDTCSTTPPATRRRVASSNSRRRHLVPVPSPSPSPMTAWVFRRIPATRLRTVTPRGGLPQP